MFVVMLIFFLIGFEEEFLVDFVVVCEVFFVMVVCVIGRKSVWKVSVVVRIVLMSDIFWVFWVKV